MTFMTAALRLEHITSSLFFLRQSQTQKNWPTCIRMTDSTPGPVEFIRSM